MNCDGFIELTKALSKNSHTIIYDQWGTGKSTLQKLNTYKKVVNSRSFIRRNDCFLLFMHAHIRKTLSLSFYHHPEY